MKEHLFYIRNYTNNEIKQAVDSFLGIGDFEGNKPNAASFNCFHISELIMSITDESLLWKTIYSLKKKGFYKNNEQPILTLYKAINTPEFTTVAKLRIKAICYGVLLKYECFFNKYKETISPFPRLQLDVNNGRVITNLDEVMDEVHQNRFYSKIQKLKDLPIQEQLRELKKIKSEIEQINYKHNSKEFRKEIKLILTMIDAVECDISAINSKNSANPHPRIFTSSNAFKLFDSMRKCVVKDLADYSFIYRKMIEDGLMHDIRDAEYRKWLEDNYQVVIEKTKQLQRCNTGTKTKIYKLLKDLYKLNNISNS